MKSTFKEKSNFFFTQVEENLSSKDKEFFKREYLRMINEKISQIKNEMSKKQSKEDFLMMKDAVLALEAAIRSVKKILVCNEIFSDLENDV